MRGVGLERSMIRLELRSLALRLCVPSPGVPALLKSKQARSTLSPRNLAICGFERNFFPQGLKGRDREFFVVSVYKLLCHGDNIATHGGGGSLKGTHL